MEKNHHISHKTKRSTFHDGICILYCIHIRKQREKKSKIKKKIDLSFEVAQNSWNSIESFDAIELNRENYNNNNSKHMIVAPKKS